MTSQEQCDRMKQICIDFGLPYWGHRDAFNFSLKSLFRFNGLDFSIMYKSGKDYIRITEEEFIQLLQRNDYTA